MHPATRDSVGTGSAAKMQSKSSPEGTETRPDLAGPRGLLGLHKPAKTQLSRSHNGQENLPESLSPFALGHGRPLSNLNRRENESATSAKAGYHGYRDTLGLVPWPALVPDREARLSLPRKCSPRRRKMPSSSSSPAEETQPGTNLTRYVDSYTHEEQVSQKFPFQTTTESIYVDLGISFVGLFCLKQLVQQAMLLSVCACVSV